MADIIRYSVNLNCRDKALKVLQYGCRLMMGYYGKSLSADGMQQLRGTLNMTLLIRRASRLFIFLSNVYNASIKLRLLSTKVSRRGNGPNLAHVDTSDSIVVETLEVFEQVFWALFFVLDTYIGFIRLGVIPVEEPKLMTIMENVYFPLWFAPDFCVFWKTIYKLFHNFEKDQYFAQQMLEYEYDASGTGVVATRLKSRSPDEIKSLQEVRLRLSLERKRLFWILFKSVVDMGVSSSFIPRTGVKGVLGEGIVGLFGMTSAVMAIVDEVNKK